MKAEWVFFQLELKRYGKRIPVIFMESLLFAFLILAFGFFAVRYVYGDRVIEKINVGIVSSENEEVSRMLVKFVSSMDSMEESCSFELMEEETARQRLADGSIYAAVILPEGMIESIMNGQNIPATVLFSTAYSRMETEVFKELAATGSRLLTTAQAGIYAADEMCLEQKRYDGIEKTEDYLNRAYLEYALNRTAVFKLEETDAAGGRSLVQYYGAALLLVFLSFAGLVMGKAAEGTKTALGGIMAARGCKRGRQMIADTLAFAVIFMLFAMAAGVPLLWIIGKNTGFQMETGDIFLLFTIFFTMGIFIRALIFITGNKTAGLGVSFLILLMMMIASGLFLPKAFLPEILFNGMKNAREYLPYRIWLKAIFTIMD